MDETWSIFKASLTETLFNACGLAKAGEGPVKKTPWWKDNVKEVIKDKQKLYKAWVRSNLEAINTSPKNKSPGVDGITTEAILASGETGITWLTSISQKAWNERKVPDDWQRAVIVPPIWKKKGSKRDCGMCRGISLLSQVGKTYANVLEQGTRYKVEPFLSEAQMGLRKGRDYTDAIFTLKTTERNIV